MKISLQQVSKSYDRVVLNSINLELEGYNTVAVIGKSGCGKSTLLRLMTGLEDADRGCIAVNGHRVEKQNLKQYQSRIGMVFQQHNLFPHLSLLQNITLILEKTRGMKADEAGIKAGALLTQLQLEEEMNRKPDFVSGGQAQRASVARALSTDPELVFMDEPTASLDPVLTKEVLDTVLNLKKSGTRFVFVTHEISFVRQFAEYVLFMDEGGIAEQGRVDILDNPRTDKLKQFLTYENENRKE